MTPTSPAIAVIGAHYGDEGKGLVVDRLARDLVDPWIVRFNGGAQAGHTVTLPTAVGTCSATSEPVRLRARRPT